MKVSIRNLIVAVMWSMAISASACRIGGLQHTVQFSPNNSAIGMNEAKKLAGWYINARDRIGISYAWFSISYINENEKTIASA